MARTYLMTMLVIDPNDQLGNDEELKIIVENELDRVDCYPKYANVIESFPYEWDDDVPENQCDAPLDQLMKRFSAREQ